MRIRTATVPWTSIWVAVWTTGLSLGCATNHDPFETFERTPVAIEGESFLDGETLAQRIHKMRRANSDLRFFHASLDSLRRHERADEVAQLAAFLTRLMDGPVAEVLSDRREGWSPQLTQLDANLLFAQAHIAVDLRDEQRVAALLDEIENRFDGMEQLVVQYPIGNENSLEDASRHLEGALATLQARGALPRFLDDWRLEG